MRLVVLFTRHPVAVLFAMAFLVRLAAWVLTGTHPAADTPGYLDACSARVADPGGLFTELVGWEYVGFLLPLCATTLGGAYPQAWIAVQLLLSSFTCVLLVSIGHSMGSRGAGWLGGLAYALLPEAIQWDLYVLSDAWFAFLLTLTFWALIRSAPTPRWVVWPALGALAVSRPFGVPIVAAMLMLHAATGALPRIGLTRWGAAGVGASLPMVQQLLSWRQGWSDALFPALWQDGYVVHDDTTVLMPAGATGGTALGQIAADPVHFLALTAAKGILLYAPVWPRFSLLHNLIGMMSLAPVLLLGWIGIGKSVRQREPAGWLAATILLVVTGVVAVTFIDYDWRYRLPLLPILAVFAGKVAWPMVIGLGRRVGIRMAPGEVHWGPARVQDGDES